MELREAGGDTTSTLLCLESHTRPPRGYKLGLNTVRLYKGDLGEIFETGKRSNDRSVGPESVREALCTKYLDRNNIPTVTPVKALIQRPVKDSRDKERSTRQTEAARVPRGHLKKSSQQASSIQARTSTAGKRGIEKPLGLRLKSLSQISLTKGQLLSYLKFTSVQSQATMA